MGRRKSPTGSAGRSREFEFDAAAADSAVRFIENRCTFWQGEYAGQPFVLQPWQRDDIIRPLFGWKRRDPTVPRECWPRRYRMCYVIVGKGNGKTPLGAAIALLLLCWDAEPGAEVYSAAADREQASIVYQDATENVLQSPDLSKRLKIFRGSRRIVDRETRSFYRVLSSDASTKHGFRPHGIIFDELHTQPNRKLYSTLRRGLPKRRQSMMVMFTTAGEFDEDALWWTEHEYALAVLQYQLTDGEEGINDPTYLPVIYAADIEDDPDDEATLRKANPNIGASVRLEDLQADWEQAKKKGPHEQAEFKQLHLNIAGDSTKSPVDMNAWAECSAAPVCEGPCFIGIDVSSKLDLTAACAWFPQTDSALVQFWIPGENMLERKRRDAFDYPRFVTAGRINVTSGNYIDQRAIRKAVVEWADEYSVVEVGYDPRFVTDLPLWLEDHGLDVVEVRQGFALSEAINFALGKIVDRDLRHGGNPVLRWNAQNLRTRRSEDGLIKVVKKAERKRIDGFTAMLTAINRAIAHREDRGGSVFVGEVAV